MGQIALESHSVSLSSCRDGCMYDANFRRAARRRKIPGIRAIDRASQRFEGRIFTVEGKFLHAESPLTKIGSHNAASTGLRLPRTTRQSPPRASARADKRAPTATPLP